MIDRRLGASIRCWRWRGWKPAAFADRWRLNMPPYTPLPRKPHRIVDGIGGENEKGTVVEYVTDAIAALKIEDYAKAADRMMKFNGIDAAFALGFVEPNIVNILFFLEISNFISS